MEPSRRSRLLNGRNQQGQRAKGQGKGPSSPFALCPLPFALLPSGVVWPRAAPPPCLECAELLFVGAREFLSEKIGERGLWIFFQFPALLLKEIPIAQLRRHERKRPLGGLTVELFLQPIWMELRKHRLERDSHP